MYLSVWLSVAPLPSFCGARPEKYESRGKLEFNPSAILVNSEMVCFLQLGFELCYLNVSNLFLMFNCSSKLACLCATHRQTRINKLFPSIDNSEIIPFCEDDQRNID